MTGNNSTVRAAAREGAGVNTARGGYYGSIRRVFLLHSLLVPLAPMLFVSLVVVLAYDVYYAGQVHGTAGDLVEGAHDALWAARCLTLAAVAVAVAFVVHKASRLSGRMAERVAHTDREKQRLNEQMFQTAKLASIGELASGVAHEINNPLAVMIEEAGWMQDLLEEGLEKPGNREEFLRALEQIRVQGKRCKDITHKLLRFARSEDADSREARIGPLMDDLMSVVARRAAQRGVEVRAEIEDGLPPAPISASELQQVLFNLINNALDAMDSADAKDAGGRTGGILRVAASAKEDEVLMEVEDTGEGMDNERQSRIFDPFFTTKPVGHGTGLGLSICYGLVRKWGGRIKVESAPGMGTRVWFTIPLSRNPNDVAGPRKELA